MFGLLVFVLFYGSVFTQTAIPSYTGYLTDLYCWDLAGHVAFDGAPLETNPERHTVGCLLEPFCVVTGYQILELNTTSGFYFSKYILDNSSNAQAVALLEASHAIDNFIVTVSGTANGAILTVSTIVETYPAQIETGVEGYLADQQCWDLPNHIGYDGANLNTDPNAHTTACVLLTACIGSNLYILQNQGTTDSPNWMPVYQLDYESHETASAWLMSTSAPLNGLYIKVDGVSQTGTPTGTLPIFSLTSQITIVSPPSATPSPAVMLVPSIYLLISMFLFVRI